MNPTQPDPVDYDESNSDIYDKDFILEILHIGTVEGGHLPNLYHGQTREETIKAARGELVERTTPQQGGFLSPKWVVDMFNEMKDDDDFVATLASYCYECGWVGGEGYTGEHKPEFLAHPEGKTIDELVAAYVAKYQPAPEKKAKPPKPSPPTGPEM